MNTDRFIYYRKSVLLLLKYIFPFQLGDSVQICGNVLLNYCLYMLYPKDTVCPGSSYPPEKIFNVVTSENEVYTIY